jgi:hypothetical protein
VRGQRGLVAPVDDQHELARPRAEEHQEADAPGLGGGASRQVVDHVAQLRCATGEARKDGRSPLLLPWNSLWRIATFFVLSKLDTASSSTIDTDDVSVPCIRPLTGHPFAGYEIAKTL